MNNDFTQTEWVVRYLDGEMNHEEREGFEKEVQSNSGLRDELENLRATKSAIHLYGLKNRISRIHEEVRRETPFSAGKKGTLRAMNTNIYRVAASVILVLVTLGAFQYYFISPQKLYDQVYQSYRPGISRGENAYSKLEEYYMQDDHPAVIALFRRLPAPGPRELFFTGQSYLRLNRYPEAIRQFQAVLTNNEKEKSSTYHDDAEYFLALALLRHNEVKKAAPILQKIHNDKDHLYHDRVDSWFMMRLQFLEWKE